MKAFRIAVVVLTLLFSALTGWISYWNESDILPEYGDTDGEKAGFRYLKADESDDGYATVYIPDGEEIELLVLTDPQVKYPVNNYELLYGASNENTYILVERLITRAEPDLVIITGDLVMSQFTNNMKYIRRWANLFEKCDVYWAPAFGNHDSEWTMASGTLAENLGLGQSDEKRVFEVLEEYPHCLGSFGNAGEELGGNYFINLRNADGSLRYTLTIADCVNGDMNKYLRYLTPQQVEWYEENIRLINSAEYGENSDIAIKNMLFTHVPLPEVFEAYEAWEEGDDSVEVPYGVIVEGSAGAKGFEKSTMFDKIKELGATRAVFFGHYHHNDARVIYEGVDLVFVQHSGLAHYYRMIADKPEKTLDMSDIYRYGDARGGTLVTISAEGNYSVEQYLAKDNIEYDDIAIDYEAVRAELERKGWTIIVESEE